MDSDSWARFSTSASSNRSQFRSDPYDDEEIEIDDGSRHKFLCPFCAEDFDMVGLCCHLDEDHMLEVKNGVCPVCAKKVGMDLVGHIIMQHRSLLKVQNKRRFRKGGSSSTLAILRKDLREGNLQSFHGGSYIISTNNTDADPLLSIFIGNPPVKDEPKFVEPHSSDLVYCVEDDLLEDSLERSTPQPSPLSDKAQEEKARRCEFVQGLVMSTFLDDIL